MPPPLSPKKIVLAFDGIDTVHICFGVSALRPLLGIAGIDPIRKIARADLLPNLAPPSSKTEVDVNGLKVIQEAHKRIDQINIAATSLVLTTFVSFYIFKLKKPEK